MVAGKAVTAVFTGGALSSDAGLLLLSRADSHLGLTAALANAVGDRRQASKVRHSVQTLTTARTYLVAQGYEDANDLDYLGADPLLKTVCGFLPSNPRALPSQPSVSRFENMVTAKDLLRMGLVVARAATSLVPRTSKRLFLDLDTTDDLCHGEQQLCLFSKYYGGYCYAPLLLQVEDESGRSRVMAALLRPGSPNSPRGVIPLLTLGYRVICERFPDAEIVFRGDCSFTTGSNLAFCDENGIDFHLAMPRTTGLRKAAEGIQELVAARYAADGVDCREYAEVQHRCRTWSHPRRVIMKAEVKGGKPDVRFVVTSNLTMTPAEVYKEYTSRGDTENRIKEMKLDINSGRTSCHRFLANQCRLILHTAAYLLTTVIQDALAGTRLAGLQVGTLRAQLLKVAVHVIESTRRVWLRMPTACPHQDIWRIVYRRVIESSG